LQLELGLTSRGIHSFSNNFTLGKLLLQFVRMPINDMESAGYGPMFGLLIPSLRQALGSGGRAPDEALARTNMGSGLSSAAVSLPSQNPSPPHALISQ
jgi:hypothetical protein